MVGFFDKALGSWSRLQLIIVALVATAIIATFDFLTGFDLSFGLFYLVPVSISAWYLGGRSGMLFAFIGALAWFLVNFFTERGSQIPVLVVAWNAFTRLGFFTVTAVLLDSLRRSFDRVQALARTDHLTMVANNRGFKEGLQAEIDRSRRYGHVLSLMFLDLDDFKSVNDLHGHSVGDRVLLGLAALLSSSLRSTDLVGRLGGDEFAVLLPETAEQAAVAVAGKLHARIADEMQRNGWPVTASIGVVTCAPGSLGSDALLQEADRLMYQAKLAGKNRLFHATLDSEQARPLLHVPSEDERSSTRESSSSA